MDSPDQPPAPAPADVPISGRIDGWRDFIDRVRTALAAGTETAADWRLSDPDFAQWPLGERAIVDVLQQAVLTHPGTRFTLLAGQFDAFPRRHPRWLTWRQTWSHRVRCLQIDEDDAPRLRPMLLWPGRMGLRVLDGVSGRGVWTTDAATLHVWLDDFDVISQRSAEAMPGTTLGL